MKGNRVRAALSMPGNNGYRTIFARRARRAQNDTIEETPLDVRERDTKESLQTSRSENERGFLFFASLGLHVGNQFPCHERHRDEHGGEHDAGRCKDDLNSVLFQPWSQPPLQPE